MDNVFFSFDLIRSGFQAYEACCRRVLAGTYEAELFNRHPGVKRVQLRSRRIGNHELQIWNQCCSNNALIGSVKLVQLCQRRRELSGCVLLRGLCDIVDEITCTGVHPSFLCLNVKLVRCGL